MERPQHATTTAHTLRPQARGLPTEMLAALAARFGANFSAAMAVREHHGRDESPFPVTPPDAVVFAQSNEDVVDAVKLCRRYTVPLIPFGAGSSLEGQLLAVQGGLSIDVSQMNRVLDDPCPRTSPPPCRPASRASSSTRR